MRGIVILLVGSVVADYPYYTDYNSYNSVYAPTSSNISSRLQGIKRTWNPDGPFTFGPVSYTHLTLPTILLV